MTETPPKQSAWPRWRRRLLRGAVLYLLVPYVAVAGILTAFQRRLLYPAVVATDIQPRDANFSGEVETLRVPSESGIELRGWQLSPPSKPHAIGNDLTVLYFPGNSGNRVTHAADCRDFTSMGFDVVIFDYRGYGDTPGSPSEASLHHDANRIWRYLLDERKLSAADIIIFGESLGGGVATRLAAEACRRGETPAALILSSTYAELADAVSYRYPFFPVRLLLFDRFRSIDHMPDVACPVLMFHGEQDRVVPIASARRLFASISPTFVGDAEKRFVALPNEDHNSIPPSAFRDAVSELRTIGFPPRKTKSTD